MKKEMSIRKDFALLEEKINYSFKNKSLLQTALTHSSYYNENRKAPNTTPSYERLEFLGDSILQIIISEYIFLEFPDRDEGELTKMRQSLVCESALARVAKKIKLGDYLFLGKGDDSAEGRARDSVISDAFEALLAAIYLDNDKNKLSAVKAVIFDLMKEQLLHCCPDDDYKTRLQQLVQQDGIESLYYEVLSESGPAHNRKFTVAAMLNSNVIGKGSGHSKREAEQRAAREALLLFGIKDDRK